MSSRNFMSLIVPRGSTGPYLNESGEGERRTRDEAPRGSRNTRYGPPTRRSPARSAGHDDVAAIAWSGLAEDGLRAPESMYAQGSTFP